MTVPRMWSSIAEVPDGVKVRSRFGDEYVGSFAQWGRDLGSSMRLRYAAPFIEILSGDSPGRVDIRQVASVWAVMGGPLGTTGRGRVLCSLWQTRTQAEVAIRLMPPYYEREDPRWVGWRQRWSYEVKELSLYQLTESGGGL